MTGSASRAQRAWDYLAMSDREFYVGAVFVYGLLLVAFVLIALYPLLRR